MSVLDAVKDLQNQTAWQQAQDYAKKVDESSKEGNRNVGSSMGKHDFLMLLSAQLRYQDPLNPQSDSDFAAGLAQFSSLEQMQNMNSTLESMANFQSYSLIGKYAIATARVDGTLTEIAGLVEGIFSKFGVTYAQIGDFEVPISAITDVYDASHMLTTDSLMNASNNLIGRTVMAHVPNEQGGTPGVVEGIVTRITVDKGTMYAQIDDGTGNPKIVAVNMIFDIRQPGTGVKPNTPPDAKNFKPDGNGGFIELDITGKIELGHWSWDSEDWKWVFTQAGTSNETKPAEPEEENEPDEPGESNDPPDDNTP